MVSYGNIAASTDHYNMSLRTDKHSSGLTQPLLLSLLNSRH